MEGSRGVKLLRSDIRTHRLRIYTEGKAKVVAAVRRTAFIQSLVGLAILHGDDFEEYCRMNSPFSLNHAGAIHPILQFVLKYKRTLNVFLLVHQSGGD